MGIPKDLRELLDQMSLREVFQAISEDAPEYQLAIDAIAEMERDHQCTRCKRTFADTAEDMPTDITGGKRSPFWGSIKVYTTSPLISKWSEFVLCITCAEGLFEYLMPGVNVAGLRNEIKGKYLN